MRKSKILGICLEADNTMEEKNLRQNVLKKDGPASVVGLSRGIPGEAPQQKRDTSTFTIERLFDAVASRDVNKLDGLYQYLHRNMKKLSDSLYQSYGKTAMMKALLHLKDGKNETIEVLIDISERIGDVKEFVNAAYTNSYYKGQTALHIAIERRSMFYVKLLVSKGADVLVKACGKFFQPHDGPNFYFGELPLSLAACTNQPDIVDYLMQNDYMSAEAKMTDSHGNTVLHALVLVADNSKENTEFITSIYDRILKITARLHPKMKLEEKENNIGLTPLKLAAKNGKIGIFSHILQREFQENHIKHLSRKFTEWVYGPVHSSLYDLSSVDSYENNSVVEILLYGSDIPNRHKMLEMKPLSCLLEDKWKKFAAGIFIFNFLVYLVYLIIFTVVAYNKKSEPPFPVEHNIWGYLYVSGQVLTLLANVYFLVIGISDIKRKGPKLQALLTDGYYDILFFGQAILFLLATALYLAGKQEYLGFLVICLALSWVNVLYYSRGDRHMGVYIIMIQKMIVGDILRFLFVYIVFLLGFSAAVVTLIIEPPAKKNSLTKGRKGFFATIKPLEECVRPTFGNISYTILQLFKFTLGIGDMKFTQHYQYMEVFYILLIGYIILTYILLLNMLVALMRCTVDKVTRETDSIWRFQRAVTILDMEKRLPCCLKKGFRSGVESELCTAPHGDRRRCFRVKEVNWNKWNTNLVNISEDPECCDRSQQPDLDSPTRGINKGRSWRGFFMGSSIRRRRMSQSTEMSPLNT